MTKVLLVPFVLSLSVKPNNSRYPFYKSKTLTFYCTRYVSKVVRSHVLD